MDPIRSNSKNYGVLLCVSFVVVIALLVASSMTLSKATITQNVENRVFKELEATSVIQASTLKHHIEEQYQWLDMISNMLDSGETFGSEGMEPTLRAMADIQELHMFGFADLKGNAVDKGENRRGNFSDRAFFQKIVTGEVEQYCAYHPATQTNGEPRIVFAIPAYRNGKMLGVIYCSKETTVLENSLFTHNSLFDEAGIIFVCDSEGKMIVANEVAHQKCVASGADDANCSVFEQAPDIERMYRDGLDKARISLHGTDTYASLVPLGVNDWMVGIILDADTATKTYANNLQNIQKILNHVTVLFILALGYIMLFAYVLLRQNRREAKKLKYAYENYENLLQEMNCTVVEYNPKNSAITLINDTGDPYGISAWDGSYDAYMEYKNRHKEFDFQELESGVRFAIKTRNTYSFESFFISENNNTCWVKTILIPIVDINSNLKIFVVVLDVTDMHKEFEEVAEMFMKIPGGIHRCYLSEPIHLEYFSEGLCKMLGYTSSELKAIVTSAQKYSLLIYPEDRLVFSTFVRSLAATGGTKTCEYRMMHKDGSLITVSDTMEAVESSSGIIYGYSIVTELDAYLKKQEQLRQELTETRQALEQMRIKNSNSQMQPHFLYNALASIREIVLDDPEYASELIYDFTTHLRACIRTMASDNLVPFKQELENIRAYVNIEKMRFGSRLDVQYDCLETDFDIIPLSVQPLVENAIRHGIFECGSDVGTVKVSSHRKDDCVWIEVEDDGIGFDFETTMNEIKSGKRDSTGLFNLIYRLETLLKAQVIVKSELGVGTKITVAIPIGGNQ